MRLDPVNPSDQLDHPTTTASRAAQIDLDDTHRETFLLTLIFVAACTWITTLVGGLLVRPLPEVAMVLWLLAETVCAAAYVLSAFRFRSGIVLLIAGSWIVNALGTLYLPSPFFLYLFSAISLMAGVLLDQRAAFAFTLLSTVWALIHRSVLGDDIIPAQLMTWFMLITGWVVSHGLFQALQIALNYEAYAVTQMQEAREHRGQLMNLTKALQEARFDLEKANTQLRHARDSAEEARRLKAQFAANVSHELRTPINLIVGFTEVMVTAPMSYGTPLPAPYWVDINTVYRNAKHLQSLINDILDVSQIEAGRMTVIKEETEPRQVILEVAEMIRDAIAKKGLAFNVDVPEHMPRVWMDRIRIRQVILNLLGNAIRFTDEGAIMLRASTQADRLVIEVIDTGIGIDQDDLGRVFEQFHQLEGSLSRRNGGSGLGLTLSKQFVELHRGRLEVESVGRGHGSRFRILLPLARTMPVIPAEYGPTPYTDSESARWFVVLDDDPTVPQLFERRAQTHRALSAHTEDEARHLLTSIHPTALVVDARQPYEDIKALAAVEAVPLIECPMPSGRRHMEQYGVVDYLVKPVSYEALQEALIRLARPLRTILVIDDDQDVIRLYDRMLRLLSPAYQIHKAYGAHEGLEIMKLSVPDVVILDLLMPELDGFAVIRAMKADAVLQGVPIILASAYGASDAITSTASGDLRVHKVEGFQPLELVRCIENLVDAFTPAPVPAPR